MMDNNLLQEFLAESREHLESIEPDLLELERNAENTSDETINSIFRAIHSIKGASGFFGFENLKHFSHIMESVLMMIRDKTLAPEPEVVDVMLVGVDRLTEMISDINNSETVNVAAEQTKLEAILNGEATPNEPPAPATNVTETAPTPQAPAGPSTSGSSPFDLTTGTITHALATGQILYAITVFPKKDFSADGEQHPIAMLENLTSVGELHSACDQSGNVLELDELPAHMDGETSELESVTLLYGSVLEISLIPAALSVPEDQVLPIDQFNLGNIFTDADTTTALTNNTDSPFDMTSEAVSYATSIGQHLYVLTIQPQQDFAERSFDSFYSTLGTVGSFIEGYAASTGTFPGDAVTDTVPNLNEPVYLFYGSVLEDSLMPATSGLAPSAVSNAQTFTLPTETDATDVVEVAPPPVEPPVQASEPPAKAIEATTPPSGSSTGSTSTTSSTSQESIRVRVDLLNRLMNLAGEMVLLRNQLTQKLSAHVDSTDGLGTVMQNINHTTTELQEHIMQTRMQPIGNVFNKFHRVVRDIARTLDKQINIDITGNEVELDKSIVENLSDPLTHLIRNSCDHGIETPDERVKAGKDPQGQVNLRAFQEGGQIIIAIQDDGRGIDTVKLTAKAIEKGVITPADAERMSEKEKVNLIFHPGFSTVAKISDVSGRGVGMDVVKTNIEKLGGTIEVDTEVGIGTIIHLHLPLTLAIIPSLVVGVDDYQLAIPQINIVELINVRKDDVPKKIETVGSASVFRLRGKLLPLIRLSDVLGLERTYVDPITGERESERRLSLSERRQMMEHPEVEFTPEGRMMLPRDKESGDRREEPYQDLNIVVLKLGGKQYGLVVDHVRNLEEIVVKPLSQYLQHCRCYAGSTIMGDGSVTMILDVGGVAEQAKLDFSKVDKEDEQRQNAEQNGFSNSNQVEMDIILFALNESPDADRFAVPLQRVLRLEKFETSSIQVVGNREYLTYQGHSLPLIRLEEHLPVAGHDSYQNEGIEEAYLILPRPEDGEREGKAAFIAHHIVDVDTVAVTLETSHMQHPGVKGAAVVNDIITTFIEPSGFMPEDNEQYADNSNFEFAYPG